MNNVPDQGARPHNHERQAARRAQRQALFRRAVPLIAAGQGAAALLMAFSAGSNWPLVWLAWVAISLTVLAVLGGRPLAARAPGRPGWPNVLAGALGGIAWGAAIALPGLAPDAAAPEVTGLAVALAVLAVAAGRGASAGYAYAFFVTLALVCATAAMFAAVGEALVPLAALTLSALGLIITRRQDRALRAELETCTERDEQIAVIRTLVEAIDRLQGTGKP